MYCRGVLENNPRSAQCPLYPRKRTPSVREYTPYPSANLTAKSSVRSRACGGRSLNHAADLFDRDGHIGLGFITYALAKLIAGKLADAKPAVLVLAHASFGVYRARRPAMEFPSPPSPPKLQRPRNRQRFHRVVQDANRPCRPVWALRIRLRRRICRPQAEVSYAPPQLLPR